MEGVSKAQQRVFTVVGAVLGLVVGFVVFQKVIGNKMIEAGTFVLAVFIGGAVGIIIYTLIKDGIPLLLKRRSGEREPRAPKPPRQPRQRKAPEPAPAAAEPVKERRKEPLRAAGRERPLRTERPLKPRD